MSTGRTSTDNCEVRAKLPELNITRRRRQPVLRHVRHGSS